MIESQLRRWTRRDVETLLDLYRREKSSMQIADALDRSVGAVEQKLRKLRMEGLIGYRVKSVTTGQGPKVRQERTRLAGFSPARLKTLRNLVGYSVKELADQASIHPRQVIRFEDPNLDDAPYTDAFRGYPPVADRLASALGVTREDLQVRPEPKPDPAPAAPQPDWAVRLEANVRRLLVALGEEAA